MLTFLEMRKHWFVKAKLETLCTLFENNNNNNLPVVSKHCLTDVGVLKS